MKLNKKFNTSIYNLDYDRLYWADNEIYEGEFYEGKKWGMRKYTWAGGRKYEGECKDDKKEGGDKCSSCKIIIYNYN